MKNNVPEITDLLQYSSILENFGGKATAEDYLNIKICSSFIFFICTIIKIYINSLHPSDWILRVSHTRYKNYEYIHSKCLQHNNRTILYDSEEYSKTILNASYNSRQKYEPTEYKRVGWLVFRLSDFSETILALNKAAIFFPAWW